MRFLESDKPDRLLAPLLFVLAMGVYANSFQNYFAWDDHFFIVQNEKLRNLSNIPIFFQEDTADLYRPLRTTLYAITYHFSGLNPIGYHIVGKTLNALTVVTLYFLMVLLFRNRTGAFLAALLFAFHPVHTEKVTFITSTYDILGDWMWLLSFTLYVIYRREKKIWILAASLVLMAVGLLSAETAAVAPLVIVLYDLTLGAKDRKPTVWIPYFVLLAAYLFLRTTVLGGLARGGGPSIHPELMNNLFTLGGVFVYYFKFIISPWPHNPWFDLRVVESPVPLSLILLFVAELVIMVVVAFRAKKNAGFVFAFFWFFIVLSPNTNIIPSTAILAERYIYLPSAAFAFMVALSYVRVAQNRQWRTWFVAVCLFLSAVYGFGTYQRNKDWRNGMILWMSTLRDHPNHYGALTNLAYDFYHLGEFEKSEKYLYRALEIYSHGTWAECVMGFVTEKEGKLDEAEFWYRSSSSDKLEPWEYKAKLNLSALLINKQEYAAAIETIKAVMDKYPASYSDKYTYFLNNYGAALFYLKESGWPKPYFKSYFHDRNIAPLIQIAENFIVLKDDVKAESMFRLCLALGSDDEKISEKLDRVRRVW